MLSVSLYLGIVKYKHLSRAREDKKDKAKTSLL